MEGLVCGRGGVGEGEEEFAGFEEGTGPAVDDEGDGGWGGRAVVSIVNQLGPVVGDVYLDHELVEFFVNLSLEEEEKLVVYCYWRVGGVSASSALQS